MIGASAPDPPFRGEINVLIIVGDDIGYGHMGAFGGPARTPTFDRLAKQGLKNPPTSTSRTGPSSG